MKLLVILFILKLSYTEISNSCNSSYALDEDFDAKDKQKRMSIA